MVGGARSITLYDARTTLSVVAHIPAIYRALLRNIFGVMVS